VTPGKAIHRHCVECVDSPFEVAKCGGERMLGQGDESGACYLFPYRLGKGRPSVKTIRKFCLECQGGNSSRKVQVQDVRIGVKSCPSESCVLWRFRMGKNPNIKRDPLKARLMKKRLSATG